MTKATRARYALGQELHQRQDLLAALGLMGRTPALPVFEGTLPR